MNNISLAYCINLLDVYLIMVIGSKSSSISIAKKFLLYYSKILLIDKKIL